MIAVCPSRRRAGRDFRPCSRRTSGPWKCRRTGPSFPATPEQKEDGMARVLFVEPERLARDVVADRLERAGYEVTACPGPSAPTYACLGTRGLRCPLEAAADVVVMDAELPGEEEADAASGLDLLSYYTGRGK